MNSNSIRSFLQSKRWIDTDNDWRFLNLSHPYCFIVSGEQVNVTLREHYESDNGQNGEQINSFQSLEELQIWYENNIGE